MARPARPVRSLVAGPVWWMVVGGVGMCSEGQGGGGRRGGGGGGTPPRFTLSVLRCCYLNACRPPPSSSLFHINNPITTTLSIHIPQQPASQVQIYSTSASPRHLNTPISVRRHLCRPSLPMSIENLKSYGQSSESASPQFLCTRRRPLHDALPVTATAK